ncbi:MAG: PTS sugar transporter subunit IIC [Sarcina sp.]
MNKITTWLEKYLMPIASVIGSQKHLGAMRDGFIATLAVNMLGALCVMFNGVLFKPDSLLGKELNKIAGYKDSIQPMLDKYIIPVMGRIWWATLAIITIFLVIAIAYSLAKAYDVDGLGASVTAVAAYFAILPELTQVGGDALALKAAGDVALNLGDATGATVLTWGQIPIGAFGSTNMFLGILVALGASQLFCLITKAGWTFKMPEQVPPAVSKAFSAILPAGITVVLFAILGVICTNFVPAVDANGVINPAGTSLPELVSRFIQEPLVKVGQSPFAYIGLVVLAQILWFFGLHGSNMIDPAMNTLYKPAMYENIELFKNGQEPIHILTRNFVDVYAMHGGSGATLALLVAIFFFSKRQEQRELFKIAIAPGLFQINEPVIFGLPLVLNPMFVIPFVLIPPINLTIAYLLTKFGIIGKICIETTWTTPPVLSAFLATGLDWKAALVAAGLFALSVVIYIPFVIAANKQEG